MCVSVDGLGMCVWIGWVSECACVCVDLLGKFACACVCVCV